MRIHSIAITSRSNTTVRYPRPKTVLEMETKHQAEVTLALHAPQVDLDVKDKAMNYNNKYGIKLHALMTSSRISYHDSLAENDWYDIKTEK
jgi:hypothetical protein